MTRSSLLAATLLASPLVLSGAVQAQPVTGLYIGGSGGANFLQQVREESTTTFGVTRATNNRLAFETGVVGVGSLGYGFGNGLRLEIEGDYRQNRLERGSLSFPTVSSGGREQKYGAMLNALFDLDIGSPYVFPYVGGGAGYSWVRLNGQTTSVTGSRVTLGGTDGSFAYQAIAGFSFPIPPVIGLSLTAEYRYFALAGKRDFNRTTIGPGAPFNTRVTTSDNYNHGLMLGLRYAFNVPRPAMPDAPVPVAAVPQGARNYLVFFDWDRADLTDRARQIVAEAATASTRAQVTRIEVAGHADRSGS
ncbi:MAG: outer membrane beta-barrel protein, partial [Gemmatimonadaceae bacterium]|nr:outer membrane beta-barrel protein [Acetobacteraceae bacterium]